MTGERPVQAGDYVRLIANWGSGCQWKKGIILRVVKRVESFYVCETVHNKKRQTKKVLFRFEFEPIACALEDWGGVQQPETRPVSFPLGEMPTARLVPLPSPPEGAEQP